MSDRKLNRTFSETENLSNRPDGPERLREILKTEYEQTGIWETCDRMIRAVMPLLEEIAARLDAEKERQVVQYISSRIKTPESIFQKLVRKERTPTLHKAVETFHDIAGVRIVCSFQDDVYRMVKEIRKLPDLRIIKVKDYIAHPKATGYRSIHMIAEIRSDDFLFSDGVSVHGEEARPVTGADGAVSSAGMPIRLEIQVRSAAMNYWAMLDHQLSYKNSKMDAVKYQKMQKELRSFALEIADIDKKFLKIRKTIDRL
ncbi:MAG: GTP pyrophosphokinase [Clostridiales bacterium]|nr:GTP pyrophosphokinase [Clostridiales bacterium]